MKRNRNAVASVLSSGDGSLQDRIYNSIRESILDGNLGAGSRVPSSRALSEHYQVSRNTVLSAFDRLVAEGYLVGREGSGTYVSDAVPDHRIRVAASSNAPPASTQNVATVSESMEHALEYWTRWHSNPAAAGPLSVGLGPIDEFPHAIWGRLLGRTWRRLQHKLGSHSDPAGLHELREVIAHYVRASRGLHCSSEQVLIVNGTQQAIGLAAQVLLNAGDEVMLDDPGYDGARGAFLLAGMRVCPVGVDADGMRVSEGIERWPQAKLVFTAPSHQFPLGGTLSLARRLALLDWSSANSAWVFEDDYNSEFRYQGRPIQALQGLDRHHRVIYASTFSKMLFPEIRLGFLIVPPSLVSAFKAAKYYADTSSSLVEQAVLAAFIQEGHFASHVRHVRRVCIERQQALASAIERYLPAWQVQGSDSGMHLVCWLGKGMSEVDIVLRCREAGIAVQPLSRYRQRRSNRGGIVLGFASHRPTELVAAVRRMSKLLA